MKEVFTPNLKINGREYDDTIDDYLYDSDIYMMFKDKIENQDYSFLEDESVKEGFKRRLQYIVKTKFENEILDYCRPHLQALITNIWLCAIMDDSFDRTIAESRMEQAIDLTTSHYNYSCYFGNPVYYDAYEEVINSHMDEIWNDVVVYNIMPFYRCPLSTIEYEYAPKDFTLKNIQDEEYIKKIIKELRDDRNNQLHN